MSALGDFATRQRDGRGARSGGRQVTLLWIVIVLLALLLAGIFAVVYQLFIRYGRILLRVEALERGSTLAGPRLAAPHAPHRASEESSLGRPAARPPFVNSRIERNGLKPGTRAPDIELTDLDGRHVSLSHYRERRVLLVFTDPDCVPCDAVVEALAHFDRDELAHTLAVIMVGRGDPEANRRKADAYGVTFPVVMQRYSELSRKYGIFATPVAFLISPEGVVEKPMATGQEEILALAKEAAGSVEMEDRQ